MKLEFEGTKISGVRYRKNGRIHNVKVTAEVILAGGSINTPQLLQLSGVGPAALLKSHGIEVVRDSPGVGADLQDHYQARAIVELNKPISVNDDVNNLLRWTWAGLQYALFRRGPATFSAGHVGVFTKVLSSSATPDAQIHFIPFSATSMGGSLHPFSGVTISVCQLRPESRGQVMITSKDPFIHPKIVPNYLSTDYDRRIMIEGLRLVRRIVNQSAFSKYVIKEHEPGSEKVSDEALLDYARDKGNTIFHPTSTCRMGNDSKAVVDSRLRVRGVQGVRVADCSIMPTVVSGNTNGPAIMVGEKCAHMILEERA